LSGGSDCDLLDCFRRDSGVALQQTDDGGDNHVVSTRAPIHSLFTGTTKGCSGSINKNNTLWLHAFLFSGDTSMLGKKVLEMDGDDCSHKAIVVEVFPIGREPQKRRGAAARLPLVAKP
jgi:hypothetical protein